MYMGAIRWQTTPSANRSIPVAGTRRGTSCPPGQIVITTGKDYSTGKSMVKCGYPPAPAAAPPPPAPNINVQTTVSPTLQQTSTPQVSPNVILQSGAGQVGASTSQQTANTPTAQGGGSTGSGMSVEDLERVLRQQQADAVALRAQEAELEAQRRAEEMEILRLQNEQREMDRLATLEQQQAAQAAQEAQADQIQPSSGGTSVPAVAAPLVFESEQQIATQAQPTASGEAKPLPWLWIGIAGLGGLFLLTGKKGRKK